MSQTASQETQTSKLSKRRESCWTCAKKQAKLKTTCMIVYSDKGQISLE